MRRKILVSVFGLCCGVETVFGGVRGHYEPPLTGFVPYVVMTTSDKVGGPTADLVQTHTLHDGFVGNHFPLKGQGSDTYTIGIFDTGAQVDLLSYGDWGALGIDGRLFSGSTVGLSGASGTIQAPVSYPLGIFAQGLQALGSGGLDESQLVGHGNTAPVLLDAAAAGTGRFKVPSVIGQPFVSFYTTEILNTRRVHLTHGGKDYSSPTVRMHVPGSFTASSRYTNQIGLRLLGGVLPPDSASYGFNYSDPLNFTTPGGPTTLTTQTFYPAAGLYAAEVVLVQGDPNDAGNASVTANLAIDTGAQASIISSALASSLGLPLTPDFTIEVGGIGGVSEDVPGYYIDYLKIKSRPSTLESQKLEFNKIPVLVKDIGGGVDGIIGMNLFWDRDVIFEPKVDGLGGASYFWVSDPVLLKGDTDLDGVIDEVDLQNVKSSFGTADTSLTGALGDTDGDGAVDLGDLFNLRNNYGKFASGALPRDPVAVPEPGSLLLVLLGAVFLRRGGV